MARARLHRYCAPVIAICVGVLLWWIYAIFMTSVNERANILDTFDIPRRWMYYSSFAIIVVIAAFQYWIPTLRTTLKREDNTPSVQVPHATTNANKPLVNIITINQIDWKILQSALNSYRTETNNALEQLSMTLEVVLSQENEHFGETRRSQWTLSNHIRKKISRLSELYDSDMQILENELLLPFPSIQALPRTELATSSVPLHHETQDTDLKTLSIPKPETNFTWWSETKSQMFANKVETYDSIRQVIAHLVRDWSSSEGAPIHASIYQWCIEQLQLYQYTPSNGPILVPGAGLGRLAWEISRNLRCTVEAIESSTCMTAAAHSILNVKRKNAFVLHPFAADAFSNEIDNEARYDEIYFPDVVPSFDDGTISYTVGTFGLDSMQHRSKQFGAVVTSFFIDTSTTVYDVVSTIAMVLSHGGLWINVGPLQWHINNKVPVTVNELRMLLENYRDKTSGRRVFHILHWSVDKNPIRYRNHGGRNRSTYYDGYCPLRFVIRRNTE